MRLLKQELLKIWRPGIVAAIAVLGALYYFLFPSFYIEYFCNGPAAEAEFQLAVGWVEKYGTTMEIEERAELDGQRESEIGEFNALLKNIPDASAAGISDYDSFIAFCEEYYDGVMENGGHGDEASEYLISRIIGGTNYYTIDGIESVMRKYDRLPKSQYDGFTTNFFEQEQSRILELEAMPRGFIPAYSVENSTREYGKDLAVWVVLSVVLLLSPTLVRDRLYRMRQYQWSSRCGRSVLRVQLAAGLLSAFVLTSINIAVYGVPFAMKGALIFRDCPLYTFNDGGYTWFNWTYGQYLLVLIALVMALGLCAGALTLFLSQYSTGYVAMLLKAIPLFIAVGVIFGSWLLDGPFYFKNLYENAVRFIPKGTEAFLIGAFLILGFCLCAAACRRQAKREL